MSKRPIAYICIAMALLLSGCGGGDPEPDQSGSYRCIGGILYGPDGVPVEAADPGGDPNVKKLQTC